MSYQNGELGHCYDDSNAEDKYNYACGYAAGYPDGENAYGYCAGSNYCSDYIVGYSHGYHAGRSMRLAENQCNSGEQFDNEE